MQGSARALLHVQTCTRCSLPCSDAVTQLLPGLLRAAQPCWGSPQTPSPPRSEEAQQQLSRAAGCKACSGLFFPPSCCCRSLRLGWGARKLCKGMGQGEVAGGAEGLGELPHGDARLGVTVQEGQRCPGLAGATAQRLVWLLPRLQRSNNNAQGEGKGEAVAQSRCWDGGDDAAALPWPRGCPQRSPCSSPQPRSIPAIVQGRAQHDHGSCSPSDPLPVFRRQPWTDASFRNRPLPAPEDIGEGRLPQQVIPRGASLPRWNLAPPLPRPQLRLHHLRCVVAPGHLMLCHKHRTSPTGDPTVGLGLSPAPSLPPREISSQWHQPLPVQQENPSPLLRADFLLRAAGSTKHSQSPATASEPNHPQGNGDPVPAVTPQGH